MLGRGPRPGGLGGAVEPCLCLADGRLFSTGHSPVGGCLRWTAAARRAFSMPRAASRVAWSEASCPALRANRASTAFFRDLQGTRQDNRMTMRFQMLRSASCPIIQQSPYCSPPCPAQPKGKHCQGLINFTQKAGHAPTSNSSKHYGEPGLVAPCAEKTFQSGACPNIFVIQLGCAMTPLHHNF